MKEKANRRDPCAGATGESDGDVALKKFGEQRGATPCGVDKGKGADQLELAKGSHALGPRPGQVLKRLERVRQRAEADKKEVFVNLFSLLKVPLLWEAFYSLKRSASVGLDGVEWYEYERQLEVRLPQMQDELHKGSYRAIPAKRSYMEKPSGWKLLLGVQAVEDKMVQMPCVMILNEVYEPMFKNSQLWGKARTRSPQGAGCTARGHIPPEDQLDY